MVLNDIQRQLLDRVAHDRDHRRKETFYQMAQTNILAAIQFLETTYGEKK